jgi:hypothetical protein
MDQEVLLESSNFGQPGFTSIIPSEGEEPSEPGNIPPQPHEDHGTAPAGGSETILPASHKQI